MDHEKKLIVTRGLPGSGKSTWAHEQPAIVVNKDKIRAAMKNYDYERGDESKVLTLRDEFIEMGLYWGLDVISDDTNLNPYHIRQLQFLAEAHDAEFEIVDFDVDIETCIARDAQREEPVGEDVIRGMAKKWLTQSV